MSPIYVVRNYEFKLNTFFLISYRHSKKNPIFFRIQKFVDQFGLYVMFRPNLLCNSLQPAHKNSKYI